MVKGVLRREKYVLIGCLFLPQCVKLLCCYIFAIKSGRLTKVSNGCIIHHLSPRFLMGVLFITVKRIQTGLRVDEVCLPFKPRMPLIYICRMVEKSWLDIKNTR